MYLVEKTLNLFFSPFPLEGHKTDNSNQCFQHHYTRTQRTTGLYHYCINIQSSLGRHRCLNRHRDSKSETNKTLSILFGSQIKPKY